MNTLLTGFETELFRAFNSGNTSARVRAVQQ
jgi:hypothetical protein